MEFRTMFLERLEARGLALPCEPRQLAIVERSIEVRARAAAEAIHPDGLPFVQLCGAFMAFVHLPAPVSGVDDGWTFHIPGGWVAVTPGVSFREARPVIREVGTAMAGSWTVNGPAEFHPEEPDFERGSLVLPVRPACTASPLPAVLSSRLLVTAIPGL